MLARRDNDAQSGAGIDIDMRIDAALADKFEIVQALEQRRANFRPLADENQDLGIA